MVVWWGGSTLLVAQLSCISPMDLYQHWSNSVRCLGFTLKLFLISYRAILLHDHILKGEVRSWSNLISEERVKFSEQNSENLMKIGWKIRKLWNFEVSQIFRKHFLTSPYEYANEWVDDVIASLLAIYFVHKILKILIFAPTFDSYVPHIKIYWC